MNRGYWYGIAAQVVWGLSPIYWTQLTDIPAPLLIAHRVVWSSTMLALLLVTVARYRIPVADLDTPTLRGYLAAAILIVANWLTYIWAVANGFIVEASLGYFITPLVSVGLGVVVLGERLRNMQWLAVALAATGLVYLTFAIGSLPRIAIVLAGSFGVYGLVKKRAPLGAVEGLTVETGLLCLPALVLMVWGPFGDTAAIHARGWGWLWIGSTGLVTVVPLVLFAASVQRIPLAHAGLIQYLAPTLQLLLGVLVYGEPFGQDQLVGYGLVWAALIIFSAEGLWVQRISRRRVP